MEQIIEQKKEKRVKLERIPFSSGELVIIKQLSKWMMIFVFFYLGISLFYFGLAVYFFINGFGSWELEPKEVFAVIPVIIGLVAQLLAKELFWANKYIKLVIKTDIADQKYLQKTFKRLKNFFFAGALFLICFLVLLIFVLAFVFINGF